MRREIKRGLEDVTPDFKNSKECVRQRILKPTKSKSYMPRVVLGCFMLLSIVVFSVFTQQNTRVQSFSPETLAMYSILNDSDQTEHYKRDLVIAEYGARQGVDLSKRVVNERVEALIAAFPTSFEKAIQQKNIPLADYKKHYLTLQAQRDLTYEALLPTYAQHFPRIQEELLSTLLLFDAAKAVGADLEYGEMEDIQAVVVDETDELLTVLRLQKADFLEEQLIIYPKNEVQHFEIGDTILLKNSYVITKFKKKIRKYAVSESIEKIAPQPVPLMQKQITQLLEQGSWQPVQPETKPVAPIVTANGEYSVWDEDALIIGDGELGIVIPKAVVKQWFKAWQEVH
ncbi:MAG: hypothetical protein ABS948_08475 [Solibacillus sp.]